MRWWGWGEDGARRRPARRGRRRCWVRRSGFDPGVRRAPGSPESDVRLPEPQLPSAAREAVARAAGAEHVRDDRPIRLGHAAGRSLPRPGPPALRRRRQRPGRPGRCRLRSGGGRRSRDLRGAGSRSCPSAAEPASWSAEPLRDGFSGVVSLDLGRLDRVARGGPRLAHRDARGRPARPRRRGAPGARASRSATTPSRSSSRRSGAGWRPARPGRPPPATADDEMVEGLRLVAPAGEMTRGPPGRAAGPTCASCWSAPRGCWG